MQRGRAARLLPNIITHTHTHTHTLTSTILYSLLRYSLCHLLYAVLYSELVCQSLLRHLLQFFKSPSPRMGYPVVCFKSSSISSTLIAILLLNVSGWARSVSMISPMPRPRNHPNNCHSWSDLRQLSTAVNYQSSQLPSTARVVNCPSNCPSNCHS